VTLSHARDLLDAVIASGVAVPAFNVISLEHAEGIVAGADRAGVGVLLQLSENAVRYHGGRIEPLAAACRELAVGAAVPVGIHLDHFEDAELVSHAIEIAFEYGIGSIMFDASKSEYDQNLSATRAVVLSAHDRGLWVEAELGEIGGKDGAHAFGVRTNPADARAFVERTGVDGLAVAVGSSHAMTGRTAVLDDALIRELDAVVGVPLVLHGSSGVPDAGIRSAVAAGIRKVNVGTALNVAWTTGVRAALVDNPETVDPRKYFSGARDAVATLVAELCGVIGR
jgi:fructose-bisphosphate aldolase class II